MAVTVEDARAMVRATEEAGVKLMIAYRLHFEEANLTAMARTQDGTIGRPKLFSSVFSHQVRPGDIRTRDELGGGGLLDLGVYPINAARHLFRDEPIEVLAVAPPSNDPRFRDVDETVSAILRFPRGEVAQFTISQGAAAVSSYRVVGTEGDLRVDQAYEYTEDIDLVVTRGGKSEHSTFPRRDQFAAELLYFAGCIRDDAEPEPSGEEGLCDLRVVEAIAESLRTGRGVELPHHQRARRPDLSQSIHKPPAPAVKPVNAPAPSLD
jgi:predicted dehydrogenase